MKIYSLSDKLFLLMINDEVVKGFYSKSELKKCLSDMIEKGIVSKDNDQIEIYERKIKYKENDAWS